MEIKVFENPVQKHNYYGNWYEPDWNEVKERLILSSIWKGDCLEWQRAKKCKGRGYGAISICQKKWLTHRAMWRACKGEIPEGMCILHKCDNEKCVNIDHLFLGTMKDNSNDMIKKGRRVVPDQRGEKNPSAKLTYAKVNEIRKLRSSGLSSKEIAFRYRISINYVYILCKGQRWASEKMSS